MRKVLRLVTERRDILPVHQDSYLAELISHFKKINPITLPSPLWGAGEVENLHLWNSNALK